MATTTAVEKLESTKRTGVEAEEPTTLSKTTTDGAEKPRLNHTATSGSEIPKLNKTKTSASEHPKLNRTSTILSLTSALGKTAGRAVSSPLHPKAKRARTYRRDVLYKLLRHIISDFDGLQGQWVLPGTDAVYAYTSRRRKWKRNTVELEHLAKGHWLGHSDAKYVLLYCHGGGYVAPCTTGHMKWQFRIQKYLRKQGIDISVLSLSYELAPKSLHPAFIRQSLSALHYLTETMGRDPGTILLGGDSAGGNMVANLLLHLGHPHPDCLQYTLKSKLKGALLISPWVSFDTTTPSITRNAHTDYITKKAIDYGAATFIGPGTVHDAYSEPAEAPVEWWKSVAENVVDKILVWGGGGEILIDGIKKFAYNVMSGFEDAVDVQERKNELMKMMTVDVERLHPEVELRAKLIVSPGEAHVEMVVDQMFYITKEEDGGKQIKKWLLETLLGDSGMNGVAKSSEQTVKVVEDEKTEGMPEFQGVADTKETIKEAKVEQEKLDAAAVSSHKKAPTTTETKGAAIASENVPDTSHANERVDTVKPDATKPEGRQALEVEKVPPPSDESHTLEMIRTATDEPKKA